MGISPVCVVAQVHRDAARNFDSKPPLLGGGLHHIQPSCSDGQCVFPTPEKVQGVFAAEKKEETKMVGGLTYIGEPARMVIWNPKDNNYYLPTYCRNPLPS